MIIIPNMDKPKSCNECPCNSDGYKCGALDVFTNDVDMLPNCPLIEIVQCKDCKWAKKEGDEGDGNLTCACHIPRYIVPSDGFCYLGERRSE